MATTTTTYNEENPKKTLVADPNSAKTEASVEKAPPSTIDATAKDDAGGEEPKAENAGGDAAVGSGNSSDGGSSVNDTQKKIRRAERFGMPVQLSEVEKRNSRAERFGTGSGSGPHGSSDATKKSEDLKRKARAERFGTAATQSVPSAEEEKKKARLARFAPASTTDLAEDHKKKARALRFSESQVNGKDKIEPTAAIAGKAGGGT